jgi:hypothetical protein
MQNWECQCKRLNGDLASPLHGQLDFVYRVSRYFSIHFYRHLVRLFRLTSVSTVKVSKTSATRRTLNPGSKDGQRHTQRKRRSCIYQKRLLMALKVPFEHCASSMADRRPYFDNSQVHRPHRSKSATKQLKTAETKTTSPQANLQGNTLVWQLKRIHFPCAMENGNAWLYPSFRYNSSVCKLYGNLECTNFPKNLTTS